jgi:tetratricopeptide (TPR) repeat protein
MVQQQRPSSELAAQRYTYDGNFEVLPDDNGPDPAAPAAPYAKALKIGSLDSVIAAVEAASGDPSKLSAMPFPEAMATIHRLHLTGTLAVFTSQGRRSFLFVEGELRAAASEHESESLESWLVHGGVINSSTSELEDRPERSISDGLSLNKGVMKRASLERELQELARHICKRAATETRAELAFCEGHDGTLPWASLPSWTTSQIVLETARAGAAKLAQSVLEPRRRVVVANRDLDDLLVDFELAPSEAYLLSRLDEGSSITELVDCSGLPVAEVEAALYTLFIAGIVGFEEVCESAGEKLSEKERQERQRIMNLASRVNLVDHYQALGIADTADQDTVVKAWEQCQKSYDPDRSAERHLHDQEHNLGLLLERARDAFDVLASPKLRKRYDQVRTGVIDQAGVRDTREMTKESIEARRELVAANLRRAEELIAARELHLAVVLLETAVAVEPKASTYVRLASILGTRTTTTTRALNALRSAVDLDPESIDAWLELARIWERRGNPNRQRRALEHALEVDPGSERVSEAYRDAFGEEKLEQALTRISWRLGVAVNGPDGLSEYGS